MVRRNFEGAIVCALDDSAPTFAQYLAKTSELGIRMALGARRDQLLQLMLFDGLRLRPAVFGLDLGLLLSFAATRIFQ